LWTNTGFLTERLENEHKIPGRVWTVDKNLFSDSKDWKINTKFLAVFGLWKKTGSLTRKTGKLTQHSWLCLDCGQKPVL
jgi:hypothetical protein